MKNIKGFTLIELVSVIVLLGVLAVTAAPRFLNLSSDAKDSVLFGLKGTLLSGLDIVHSEHKVAGEPKELEVSGETLSFWNEDTQQASEYLLASSALECESIWNVITTGIRASVDSIDEDSLIAVFDEQNAACQYYYYNSPVLSSVSAMAGTSNQSFSSHGFLSYVVGTRGVEIGDGGGPMPVDPVDPVDPDPEPDPGPDPKPPWERPCWDDDSVGANDRDRDPCDDDEPEDPEPCDRWDRRGNETSPFDRDWEPCEDDD